MRARPESAERMTFGVTGLLRPVFRRLRLRALISNEHQREPPPEFERSQLATR